MRPRWLQQFVGRKTLLVDFNVRGAAVDKASGTSSLFKDGDRSQVPNAATLKDGQSGGGLPVT